MSSQCRTFPAIALVASLCALCATPLQAAQYCVESSSGLVFALAAAAQSDADDDVRLRSGSYILSGDINLPVHGALTVRGGWGLACVTRSKSPEATTIGSATAREHGIVLRPQDDDLSVEQITFDRLHSVVLQDEGVADSVIGTIALLRNRFVRNQVGPLLRPRDKNLRVQNNIIVDTVQRSLQIQRALANDAVIVNVHFNTILGGTEGARISGSPSAVQFRNNLMDAGASDGALVIVGGSVAATRNLLGAINLEDGGTAAINGTNFFGVDPLLDADLIPLEGSPALHTGTDSVYGGLPATDYAGSARKIGSHVDIGARESTRSDIDTLVVTSVADTGAGTLRQAILDANLTPNGESIAFDIDGGCPRFITLATPLPTISTTLTIDGYTQPGSSPHSSGTGATDSSVHCVALFGDGARVLNLTPAAEQEITVRGLAFYRSTDTAIRVSGAGRATIVGNTFNTGTSVFETSFPDYAISVDGADNTLIGGSDFASRNIIGRANVAGIRLGPGFGRVVMGNRIGTAKNGSSAVGNGIGVLVIDGESDSLRENFIGNSVTDGLRVQGSQSVVSIHSNVFGLAPAAGSGSSPAAPNGRNGIRLEGGRAFDLQNNRVLENLGDGIAVLAGAKGANLANNSILRNGLLGIDLSPDGINPIDTDTGATGANGSQNFPVLMSAGGGDVAGTVAGELRSANGNYDIVIHGGSACDASGHGEGGRRIGSAPVIISNGSNVADGIASFTINVSDNISGGLGGRAITAIATESSGPDGGSSSEFSACIEYEVLEVFRDGFES